LKSRYCANPIGPRMRFDVRYEYIAHSNEAYEIQTVR
jgi:hypothetical protein